MIKYLLCIVPALTIFTNFASGLETSVVLVRNDVRVRFGEIEWLRPELGEKAQTSNYLRYNGESVPPVYARWHGPIFEPASLIAKSENPIVLKTNRKSSASAAWKNLSSKQCTVDLGELSGVGFAESSVKFAFGSALIRSAGDCVVETPNSILHISNAEVLVQTHNTAVGTTESQILSVKIYPNGRVSVDTPKALPEKRSVYYQTNVLLENVQIKILSQGGLPRKVDLSTLSARAKNSMLADFAPYFNSDLGFTEISREPTVWEFNGTGVPKTGVEPGRGIASLQRRTNSRKRNFKGGQVYQPDRLPGNNQSW